MYGCQFLNGLGSDIPNVLLVKRNQKKGEERYDTRKETKNRMEIHDINNLNDLSNQMEETFQNLPG